MSDSDTGSVPEEAPYEAKYCPACETVLSRATGMCTRCNTRALQPSSAPAGGIPWSFLGMLLAAGALLHYGPGLIDTSVEARRGMRQRSRGFDTYDEDGAVLVEDRKGRYAFRFNPVESTDIGGRLYEIDRKVHMNSHAASIAYKYLSDPQHQEAVETFGGGQHCPAPYLKERLQVVYLVPIDTENSERLKQMPAKLFARFRIEGQALEFVEGTRGEVPYSPNLGARARHFQPTSVKVDTQEYLAQ